MTELNGSHVTWRELNLLRETINQRFDSLEEKLDELVEQPRARWRDRAAFRSALMTTLIASVVAGGFTVAAAFIH